MIGKKLWVVALTILLVGGCASKSVAPTSATQNFSPNMAVFSYPRDQVWDTLIKIVRFDYLYELDVVEPDRGYFVTDSIRDTDGAQWRRFRLTATVTFDGTGSVVVLYKQEERRNQSGGSWFAVESDLQMERQLLRALRERLQPSET